MTEMLIERFALNPLATNTYVVADSHGEAWIVDPCAVDMSPVIDFVAARGFCVRAIVNTHCHFDHVLGNERVRAVYDAPLWLHRAELPNLHGAPARAQSFLQATMTTRDPDRFLDAGETLALGDLSFQVLFTPGHSPGGICLYEANEGVLLSGDTLFAGAVGRWDLPGSDYDQLVASLRDVLWPLPDATIVYPGHEEDTTIGEERMVNPYFRF